MGKTMQVEVDKTNLLNLFYEIEFRDDGADGLNENEYKIFTGRLDDATAAKFKSFREMDINGDGNIDMDEFQTELDRIYNRGDEMKQLKAKNDQNTKRDGNAKA